MDIQKITNEYRLNQWVQIITECRSSGQKVKSWCEEHNINLKSYYYWQKKVRAAACNSLASVAEKAQQIVPISISDIAQPTSSTTKPVPDSQPAIVIHLNSVVIEIHNGTDDCTIENTLRAVKNIC